MSCNNNNNICNCDNTGLDYYGILSLNRNSNDLDIKKAFRRLAISHHPKAKGNNGCFEGFSLIAEAYDVLSDPLKRAVYDQYGEEGLKHGVPGPNGFIEPYVYHGEPMKTYREFFATENPYADLLDHLTRPQTLLEFSEGRGIKIKDQPVINKLQLSLQEVYFGGTKKMKIQRLVFVDCTKMKTEIKEDILTIPIKPGILTGTKMIYPEMGDQSSTKISADIIFIVEDRPHETFQRKHSDLHMIVNVFLKEALTGITITVNTIDDRIFRVPITSIITPDYRKIIKGEGLPLPDNPKEKGNLILNFHVEFPIYLSIISKDYVHKAFELLITSDTIENTEYLHRYGVQRYKMWNML
ncbi:PREDICTED: dnaJ homolog subfamily B member 13-like [Polistes dominula]|uniref:DnaJ homolog subfamily B member 13-like n=1 Tax=Polistes dominula TaxID=743375 RepID=A0ABM1IIF3_POLDO|nr:PREDICTED: dnaJ homolog subfamily B member 13-like [Polistes dominula]